MNNYASILPGARVRSEDGFIGTVEGLERHWAEQSDLPDRMIVRSDDRHWRYSIPLMFVSNVTQGTFQPIVHVSVRGDELTHYILGPADEQPLYNQPTTLLSQRHNHNQNQAQRQSQSNGQGQRHPMASGTAPDDDQSDVVLRMPIHEERLVVRKQPIVLGKVHVHKGVESEEQRIALPVYHEEAIVEHISVDQYNGMPSSSNPNETIIPVFEERLVVKKETVVKEYLRVRKQLVPQQQEVHGTVRHEVVEISEQRQDGVDPSIPILRDRASALAAQPASEAQSQESSSTA
jgi:uncharacterized protein (TIGR02271 family)